MRKKLKFYKDLLIELIETMCTICLYLEEDAHRARFSRYQPYFHGHFNRLKEFSEKLRGINNVRYLK